MQLLNINVNFNYKIAVDVVIPNKDFLNEIWLPFQFTYLFIGIKELIFSWNQLVLLEKKQVRSLWTSLY